MATLAFNPAAPIAPPSKFLALTELPRALAELSSLGWLWPALMTAPKGDGHPVMVLPGFVTTDASTRILRRYLTALGYDAHPWKLGRNLGPRAIGREGERLVARLDLGESLPLDTLAYRFDIVLRGRRQTPFENKLQGA